jgi:hypothetical protein
MIELFDDGRGRSLREKKAIPGVGLESKPCSIAVAASGSAGERVLENALSELRQILESAEAISFV